MTPSAAIRVIREADWPAIDRIQRECFPPSAIESRETLQSIARHSPGTCLFAETTAPVGYVLAHPWTADDLPPLQAPLTAIPAGASSLFIHDLAVAPAARGAGLARRLVDDLLDRARRLGLARGSLLSVQDSRRFWARYGFQERPDLTDRFRETVARLYQVEFVFMTSHFPGSLLRA